MKNITNWSCYRWPNYNIVDYLKGVLPHVINSQATLNLSPGTSSPSSPFISLSLPLPLSLSLLLPSLTNFNPKPSIHSLLIYFPTSRPPPPAAAVHLFTPMLQPAFDAPPDLANPSPTPQFLPSSRRCLPQAPTTFYDLNIVITDDDVNTEILILSTAISVSISLSKSIAQPVYVCFLVLFLLKQMPIKPGTQNNCKQVSILNEPDLQFSRAQHLQQPDQRSKPQIFFRL